MKNIQQMNENAFNEVITQIQQKKVAQSAIRAANKIYDIKNFKVNNITVVKAKKIYISMIEKYRLGCALEESWLQNQRRLYLWLLLCFIHLNNKTIQNMVLQDYSIFSTIFNHKQQSFLKFQAFALIKKQKKQRKWASDEDELLYQIITSKPQAYQKQWNQISKAFFNQSNQQFHRNAKQCRQRWFNHLDPNKIRGKWTVQQDLILLRNVKQNGKKWSQFIPKLGDCKTEHMIKNRFNSLINRKKKELNSKNEEKMLNKLIQQCELMQNFDEKQQQAKISQKQSKQYRNCEVFKSDKNQEMTFEPGAKKLTVQKVVSLSTSEKGGVMLPDLANPFMEQMDSAQEKLGFRIFSVAPNSQSGYSNSSCNKYYDLRSPFMVASPFNMANSGNITPSIFFLDQNTQKENNYINQDFMLSCSSNFDKFIPDSQKANE